MQGQRSAVGSLPELTFHNDSATSDSGMDPQRCWNNMRNPAQDQLSDCVISASNASVAYLNSAGHEGHTSGGWNLGESSSSVARDLVNQNERVSVYTGAAQVLGGRQHGSSDILSLNNADMITDQAANGRLFMQNSISASIPLDQYASSEFSGRDDDDCQIIECPGAYKSGSSSERLPGTSSSEPCGTPSASGGYLLEESDNRPSCSLDGRRLSCKRKTIEGSAGQSSGSGSSNPLQDGESSFWHTATAHHNTASTILAPPGNNLSINLPEQVHPRLALSVGRAASEVPLTLSASASVESSRRNFRLRINASHQQDYVPGNVTSTESVGGSSNVLSAQRSLRLQPNNNSMDLGPFSAADNGSAQRQSVAVHAPSLRQNPHSRWYRASSSGASSSSSAFSGERDAVPYEGPFPRSVPRNISEHPMFLPAIEMGNSSQSPVNWSLAPGNINIAGNAASTPHAGLSSGVNPPAPSLVPNRNSPQYPRRLSEFVRRSLLSSTGTESGSHNSTYTPVHLGPASSSREIAHGSGSGHHGHRRYTRSAVLLERHLGSALGFPYSGRTSAAATEGRNRLVSEIRNVLDLMRRGEGLRFEDVMVLDQSVFFGMADIDDRHRDMRLDVDNMSYEELLALEERIGNVCTGLNEETIMSKLKQRKYVCMKTEGEVEAEPCCVCQEEYNDGEDLGMLECGHDFHAACIKQWLMQKNLCPICKTTGLTK